MEPGSLFSELQLPEDQRYVGILKVCYGNSLSLWSTPVFLRSLEIDGLYMVAPTTNCSTLRAEECQLLLGIGELKERVAAFVDAPRLQKFTRIRVGATVDCFIPSDPVNGTKFRGSVKWIGKLRDKRGTQFGVELLVRHFITIGLELR